MYYFFSTFFLLINVYQGNKSKKLLNIAKEYVINYAYYRNSTCLSYDSNVFREIEKKVTHTSI